MARKELNEAIDKDQERLLKQKLKVLSLMEMKELKTLLFFHIFNFTLVETLLNKNLKNHCALYMAQDCFQMWASLFMDKLLK